MRPLQRRAVGAEHLPAVRELKGALLRALAELGGSGTAREIEAVVVRLLQLRVDVRELLHRGGPQTELSYRLLLARAELLAEDAIAAPSDRVWALLDAEGDRSTTVSCAHADSDPSRKGRSARLNAVEGFPEDQTSAELEPHWPDAYLRGLLRITPAAFEEHCQLLLRTAGAEDVVVTGRTGDGGLDGHALIRLGLLSFRVVFQSKRVRGSIGAPSVRDFRGAVEGRAEHAILFTTGRFTSAAEAEANRVGTRRIELIDGQQLSDLAARHSLRCPSLWA